MMFGEVNLKEQAKEIEHRIQQIEVRVFDDPTTSEAEKTALRKEWETLGVILGIIRQGERASR